MLRRAAFAVVLSLSLVTVTGPIHASENQGAEGAWVTLFDGKKLWGWTAMHLAMSTVDRSEDLLRLSGGMGWLRSDQRYEDFVLEFETRVQDPSAKGGIYFQANLEGSPFPDTGYRVSLDGQKLIARGMGEKPALTWKNKQKPEGGWNRWSLQLLNGQCKLALNEKVLWEAKGLASGAGPIGFHVENSEYELRNVRIQEIGYMDLLSGEGQHGAHLTVHSGQQEAWTLKDGVLACAPTGGGWIGTRTGDFGNFDLKLEYLVPKNGNSGVFLRCPLEGDAAYKGMEIQVIDDDATKWELQDWQKTGAIYHEVSPSVRATREAGTWQSMEILADKNWVKIYINGVQIIDADLDTYTTCTTNAAPLKDRPRQGYIGFQHYGSGAVSYRNLRVKRLK